MSATLNNIKEITDAAWFAYSMQYKEHAERVSDAFYMIDGILNMVGKLIEVSGDSNSHIQRLAAVYNRSSCKLKHSNEEVKSLVSRVDALEKSISDIRANSENTYDISAAVQVSAAKIPLTVGPVTLMTPSCS
ncbi:hypothetical protein B0H10DRAFT_2066306 [Mycena sp. CBHHK59/15]|nr:hypothetical protein B0H10DRAFT_2066306 [Mycena sp. CBHHK59/15]